MKILITGGSGFLGARLARTLLAQGQLSLAGTPAQAIESVTLADRAPPPDDLTRDPRVKFVGGDLNEQIASRALPAAGTDVVFHLAAAVSGECEADFDLGMHSNFDATRALLDGCRALGTKPTFVFASSLAVFGNLPGQPLRHPEIHWRANGRRLRAQALHPRPQRASDDRERAPRQAQRRCLEFPQRHDP